MSKWKAGQCVTIEGKRYRVVKSESKFMCTFCDFRHKPLHNYPCFGCIYEGPDLIPVDCCFQRIKPKS